MSSVLGIDYSTKAIDLVYLDETSDAARWHRIPLETGIAGIRKMRHAYAWAAELEDVYLVAVEDPMSVSMTSAKKLGRVCGAVMACIPQSLEVWLMRPDEWRMACGMAGNASKAAVMEFALLMGQEAGTEDWFRLPQDACDAYCMAYAAREINAKAIGLGEVA